MARRAFTLVELLVVVAVIGILIGVLLPALGGARRSALTVAGLSNIRQLEIAQLLYCNDHEGQLVDYGLAHAGSVLDPKTSWVGALAEYYDDPKIDRDLSDPEKDGTITPKIIRSPVDHSPHWSVADGGEGVPVPPSTDRFRLTSYGLNEHVTPRPPIDPLTGQAKGISNLYHIKQSARIIQFLVMAFEGEYAGSDHVHPSNWWLGPNAPDAPPQLAAEMVQTNAHGGAPESWEAKSNYGYLDGHAETNHFREIYLDFDHNRFDPTAHPM